VNSPNTAPILTPISRNRLDGARTHAYPMTSSNPESAYDQHA